MQTKLNSLLIIKILSPVMFVAGQTHFQPLHPKKHVTWDSPSKNTLGSMPASNGDIRINLWVEENGDLVFYLSKTNAWNENVKLLQLGKVRLSLSSNSFKKGMPFMQKLVLKDGVIHIKSVKRRSRIPLIFGLIPIIP
jgi:hypothetical protein